MPLVRAKNRDEEVKVRYLRASVVATEWRLREMIRTGDKTYFQSLVNALEAPHGDLDKTKCTIAKDSLPHASSSSTP